MRDRRLPHTHIISGRQVLLHTGARAHAHAHTHIRMRIERLGREKRRPIADVEESARVLRLVKWAFRHLPGSGSRKHHTIGSIRMNGIDLPRRQRGNGNRTGPLFFPLPVLACTAGRLRRGGVLVARTSYSLHVPGRRSGNGHMGRSIICLL